MPDLITTATLLKAAPLITTGVGTIWESLFPDEAKKIQMQVLDDQKNFRRMLSRQSRGIFTGSERQAIARGAEPTVNRVAGGVAARGLGGSGAGAQVIAEAQQAPFLQAQTAATQALSGANTQAFAMATQLVGDNSFFEDLRKLTAGITELYAPNPDDTTQTPQVDQEIDGLIGFIREALEGIGTGFDNINKALGTGE